MMLATSVAGHRDGVERFGDGADLIQLDEQRVADVLVDARRRISGFVTNTSSPTSCTRLPSAVVSIFQPVPVALGERRPRSR